MIAQLLSGLSGSLGRSLSSVPTLAPGAFLLVLGNLFQCRLDEFSSQIIDSNVELVNLKPSFPDFEFHVILLRLALIHAVKVLFADLLQCIFAGALQVLRLTTPLVDHLPPLSCFALLLFLQFFSCLLSQQEPEFLLPLWSHETLLVLLPCSLSLQPRPNLSLLGIHFLLFFRVRHVCLVPCLWSNCQPSALSAPLSPGVVATEGVGPLREAHQHPPM